MRSRETGGRPFARTGLIALAAFEVAAVWLLHALGAEPALRLPAAAPDAVAVWLHVTPPEDAVMAVTRLAALAAAWWLLATTAGYAVARLSGRPRAAQAASRLAHPTVRRLVDRAVVATVAGALSVPSATTALAAAGPARIVTVSDGDGQQLVLPPLLSPAAREPPRVQAASRPGTFHGRRTSSPPGSPADPQPAGTHVVVAGESLWSIAVTHAGDVGDAHDVAGYWAALVRINTARLRSGDPNLVHPGEVVRLPPPGSP